MKCLAHFAVARLALLGLAALLVFGNCSQNVYWALGPGVTVEQATQLRQLDRTFRQAYRAAVRRPAGTPGPTGRQLADSAEAQRRRILTPAQYQRYRYQVLPLRYPRRPPRGYR